MDLLEYQAKQLFSQTGIPVLPSQCIDHPKDLKDLKIPYPVVLKSQVLTGGRGKAGGIKFVENTIDAVAAAQTIFHLPIMGKYPEVLLAEAKYDAEQEFYLAVALDRSARCPVLLGSQRGGIEIESNLKHLHQVAVDQEFSLFYARRLALKMGLKGMLIQTVSSMIEKMYRLFIQKDLDLVEINPLAVSFSGELMALDGKVTANDDALGRHADLADLVTKIPTHSPDSETQPSFPGMELVELDGTIAILGNGAGLTMTTIDLVKAAGGKPGLFLNVCGENRHDCPPTLMQERIEYGLDRVSQSRDVKVVLVNLWCNVIACDEVATTIASYFERRSQHNSLPRYVIRLLGRELESAREILTAVEIFVTDDLDTAIDQAVSTASSKR
ncbi:succinate--CoA ligase subunit beta [Oculatella sp. LEGE 06141]|uniref:succinate--CoA ligase subunit beta n=1 Tax=Oculatella sp. LEGE 06141 TaxID=1828648 RepID=UPI00187FD39F|nr:succinate--CoA ligase subunit beta [Oculatella sp. LEGE 06141]MBE9181861.1 succinate--CoA ligase subunit beta [Oculatella sp. LEGE 06141]